MLPVDARGPEEAEKFAHALVIASLMGDEFDPSVSASDVMKEGKQLTALTVALLETMTMKAKDRHHNCKVRPQGTRIKRGRLETRDRDRYRGAQRGDA